MKKLFTVCALFCLLAAPSRLRADYSSEAKAEDRKEIELSIRNYKSALHALTMAKESTNKILKYPSLIFARSESFWLGRATAFIEAVPTNLRIREDDGYLIVM